MRTDLAAILVIAGSGVGNILLATPLIRSLRRAWPKAQIDVLVPLGRGEILDGNPDIGDVLEACRAKGLPAYMRFVRRIWRHYDLALSAQAGDRSIINAWIGGRKRFSHVKAHSAPRAWQKLLVHGWVAPDTQTHAVLHGLRLLDALGIPKCHDVVPPDCTVAARQALERLLPFSRAHGPYSVMHLYPRNPYKSWTAEGWERAIRHLAAHGLPVILTGGGGQEELAYAETVLSRGVAGQVVNLLGQLSLPQVSDLLSQCLLYVGPDTGVTHLAAVHGVPTVALYGPTDPVYWGPWPAGYGEDRSPFVRRGCQSVNNVFIVQHDSECIGCGKEGCDDNPRHPSRCMQELQAEPVLTCIDRIMENRTGTTRPKRGDCNEDRV